MNNEPTKEEQNAINTLKRLAKRWPGSLWIFTNGLSLNIMKTNDSGERVYNSMGCVDQGYIVDSVYIPSDGGGW